LDREEDDKDILEQLVKAEISEQPQNIE